ncbi:MAG: gliding motility-associated ABC transporter permease subunit GldF, partial [Bacteroidota bacterium]|nr:gliding motility-associated ABC transporter permease subunit GldF [Bacteroidota bacterium]
IGFDKYSMYSYDGNKQFIINSLNYLCNDQGLMSIRSREFKLRLLKKDKITNERTKWQIINLFVPIIILILLGLVFHFVRKRKYSK